MTLADSPRPLAPQSPPVEVSPRPVAPRRDAYPNLIGRAQELAQLGETFDQVAGGRALAVLIAGDAGIGKSRLVEEFCDRVRLGGGMVAVGACQPGDTGLPYAPVMGILRQIGRHLGRPAEASHLLRALGDQAGSGGASGVESIDLSLGLTQSTAPFAKTVFFEAVLQELVRLADASPVLLVFDDLHWADSASSELFDFLIRNLGDARVMTLATYRDEEFTPDHLLAGWLAELRRHSRVRPLALGPLDRGELADLLENALGKRPAATLLESVWTRSQGNPFFAEQLLAATDQAVLPGALKTVIEARIRSLPDQTQSLLGLMSACRSVVDHRLLDATCGPDSEALDAALAAAIDANILLVDPSGSGYRFRHALLQEAIYGALLPARRRRLHRSLAQALTADPSLGSAASRGGAELASHWWAAGEWAESLPLSVQAADAAIAALAFPEALTFLERSLLADQRAPEASAAAGVVTARLLEQAADVAYLAGGNERAVELARQAVHAVDAQAEPAAAARCLTLLGRNFWGVGDSAAAFEAYGQALALLADDGPSVEKAGLLAEEARGQMLMSQFGAGAQRAGDAIAEARAVGSRQVEGHALNTLGCCRGGLGFFDEAVDLIQQSLVIAEELVNPDDMNRAYGNLSSMFLDSGQLDAAVSVMFDSVAIGEDLWGVRLNGASGNGVDALVRLGRYPEAEHVLGLLGTHALGVCAPGPWLLPSPMMIRRGRFDAAERLLAEAREMTARLGDVQQAASALGLSAELALERDRPGDALPLVEQALALASRSEDAVLVPELCMWASRAIADQGEATVANTRAPVPAAGVRAEELVQMLRDLIAGQEERGAAPTARLLAAFAQTRAEASRLEASGPELWDEAARFWVLAGERYPEAYCRWRETEAVLESRGGRVRAAQSLDRAWQLSKDLEAAPLSARIVRLAQRGRLELREGAVAAPTAATEAATQLGLTAREVEVLDRLAAGRTDREIAAELFISKKTVSVHVSNLLRKLSVAGRVEAGKIGQTLGLGTA